MRPYIRQPKTQCPHCGCWYSTVLPKKGVREGRGVRRARRCDECYAQYYTLEEPLLERQDDEAPEPVKKITLVQKRRRA